MNEKTEMTSLEKTDRKELAIKMLREGKSVLEIADTLGCSTANVYRIAKDAGIDTKNISAPAAVKMLSDAAQLAAMWEKASPQVRELFMAAVGVRFRSKE